MKTKKTVIAVLTAVLVISVAFIVSCIEPLDEISAKKKAAGTQEVIGIPEAGESFDVSEINNNNYIIPAGKGIVRFKISDRSMRTIMPDPSSVPLEDMLFTVQFTHVGANGTDKTIPEHIGTDLAVEIDDVDSTPIALDPGNYTVTITAFNEDGDIPIAGWTSTSGAVVIEASKSKSVPVNLIGVITPTGANPSTNTGSTNTGNFKYDITLPAGSSYTSTFTAKNYTTNVVTSIPLTKNSTQNQTVQILDPGYYLVSLKVSQTNYQTREYVRVLHVYPVMSSEELVIVVPDLVKVLLDVTFNLGKNGSNQNITDTTSGNNYSLRTIKYGNKITALPNQPIPDAPNTGYSFVDWYKEDSFANTWDFTVDRVLADTVLYALWSPPGATGNAVFGVTFNYVDGIGNSLISSDTGTNTIRRDDFGGTRTIELTLGNAPGSGSWNTITWHVGDIDFTVLPYSSHITNSGRTLVINNSPDYWDLISDNFEVSVTAILNGSSTPGATNGATYSGTFNIVVQD